MGVAAVFEPAPMEHCQPAESVSVGRPFFFLPFFYFTFSGDFNDVTNVGFASMKSKAVYLARFEPPATKEVQNFKRKKKNNEANIHYLRHFPFY